MRKALFILVSLMQVSFAGSLTGCSAEERTAPTPQKMEELRQKNIERAIRMREEGSKR
jgi:hypothetical protein